MIFQGLQTLHKKK